MESYHANMQARSQGPISTLAKRLASMCNLVYVLLLSNNVVDKTAGFLRAVVGFH